MFDKAVDKAIADYNRDFLNDPDAIREAQEAGDSWREQLEAEGVLPEWDAKQTVAYAMTRHLSTNR